MSYGRAMKGGFVNMEQEVDIYNNCKVAITHNNFMRSGYCSDRDFRAVGCGPLVVHHFFPGVHDMFGRSAIVWTDHDDLAYSCDYFLRETYERITLAEQEHNRVITNHSWAKRMKQMFKLLDQVSAPV
jgi:spore maturation protein CgeB